MKTNKKKSSNSKVSKNTKTSKRKRNEMFSIELRNVKLSKDSKRSLRKIKDCLWGDVANAIESGMWHIPSKTHEFIDIKTDFEKSMYEFFNIPKDSIVEVDCFDTGILSFEKGVYPKYH